MGDAVRVCVWVEKAVAFWVDRVAVCNVSVGFGMEITCGLLAQPTTRAANTNSMLAARAIFTQKILCIVLKPDYSGVWSPWINFSTISLATSSLNCLGGVFIK